MNLTTSRIPIIVTSYLIAFILRRLMQVSAIRLIDDKGKTIEHDDGKKGKWRICYHEKVCN